MVCFNNAEASDVCGSGTVEEGKVSNLMVTLEADASAAFYVSRLALPLKA